MKNNCLYCYQPLTEPEVDFHKSCSKKMFGTSIPPILEYSLNEMNQLAKQVVQSQIAVTGVQAKLSVRFEPKRGEPNRFTLVGLWGNYILKPPTGLYPQMPENEDLTMHLAGIFKIKTVPHCLIRLKSGELAYLTRRIDRASHQKLHMEDLCQLSERLTEDKYKGSMEQVGKTIMRYSSNPIFDAITFFETTLFCFLTGNADMHLKNFSLIDGENGQTVMAPAYDLLSTRLVIPEKEDPEEIALTINGKKRKLNRTDFNVLGNALNLNETQITNVFRKIETGMGKALSFIDDSFLTTDMQERYNELMTERFKRVFK
jgi:serine/threonine-protein kinase HipA